MNHPIPDEQLTFDDAAWAWLVSKPPAEIAVFLEGMHGLLDALGTRGHVWAEHDGTPKAIRIAVRLLDLSMHGSL